MSCRRRNASRAEGKTHYGFAGSANDTMISKNINNYNAAHHIAIPILLSIPNSPETLPHRPPLVRL
jgi:hypothetical protein